MTEFLSIDDEAAREKFSLGKDVKDWRVSLARQDLEKNIYGNHDDKVVPISYRPFDTRYTYYTGNSKGFHCRPREEVMRHFLQGDNVGLSFHKREELKIDFSHIFVTRYMTEHSFTSIKTTNYQTPLYLYPNTKQQNIGESSDGQQNRVPNLDRDIVQAITDRLGLRFVPEKTDNRCRCLRPH